MDDHELDDFTPWTPEGAERLLEAAERLAVAVRAHAQAVVSATSDAAFPAVLSATAELMPAVQEYGEAQFAYCGNGYPFGALEEYDEEPYDELDEAPGSSDHVAVTGFSVLRRHDFELLDEDVVLHEGRRAYRRLHQGASEQEAMADVTHLGRALYQLAHAGGWAALADVPGLVPVAGSTVVIGHDELLGPDPEEWPDGVDLFDVEGEYLCGQSDIPA